MTAISSGATAPTESGWEFRAACNGNCPKRPWFVIGEREGARFYLDTATGNLRRFASRESAGAVAAELNAAVQPVATETVALANGKAAQGLVPGVAAQSLTVREIARVRASKAARRGHEPLPVGSLWDDTTRNQQSLF